MTDKEEDSGTESESKVVDPAIGQTTDQRRKSREKQQRKRSKAEEEDSIDWESEVSSDDLATLSPNEIRAVADGRGYVIPPGGRKRVTSTFLRYQDRDPAFE